MINSLETCTYFSFCSMDQTDVVSGKKRPIEEALEQLINKR